LRALVLGLDHRIQEQDNGGRLKALISGLCETYSCRLIAEEWNTGDRKFVHTVGRKVSIDRSISWLNIEIPDRVKERLGILDDLNRRNVPTYTFGKGFEFEVPNHVYLRRADCLREHRWLRKILRHKHHESVLVTCGFIHVRPFAAKLREASFEISTITLCDYPWYRAIPSNKCDDVAKELIDDRF
jgi:hypothetical protein